MRYILTLCCLFILQALTAQISPLSENFTTYVFGDKVNVRSEPKSDASVVAQLNGGEAVTILEVSDKTFNSSGNVQPWYKVRFNKTQTGYVWGGLLSYIGEAYSQDIRFAVGIVSARTAKKEKTELTEYTLETRVYNLSGAVLSKTAQTVSVSNGYYFSASPVRVGALGLKGYTALLRTTLSFDACGYPAYDWYVLWDGTKLVPLPLCSSVGDADVLGHTEKYLFPKPEDDNSQGHNGASDQVFFYLEHTEKEELGDEGSGGWNENSYVRVRPMKWDGTKFIKPKIDK